jgi:hypothetical protein
MAGMGSLTPGNIAIYNAMQQRPRIKALEDRVALLEKLVMNAPLPEEVVVVSMPAAESTPPPPPQPVAEAAADKPASSSCVIN